jgi:hypothetical protein
MVVKDKKTIVRYNISVTAVMAFNAISAALLDLTSGVS